MQAGASLAHKDLAAALELAESLDVDLPLAAMTERRTDEIFGLGEAAVDDRRDGDRWSARSACSSTGSSGRPGRAGPSRWSTRPPRRSSAWWPTAVPRTSTTPSPPPAGPSTRPAWSTDVGLRVRGLRQLQAAFGAHADELRAMTVAETGSPVSFTYSAQLDAPVEVARLGGRPGRGLRSGRPTSVTPRPWASPRTAGCGARPPAWSGPSPRGTSPTRSTWPSWARPWPPATPWSSSRPRTPRGAPPCSAG